MNQEKLADGPIDPRIRGIMNALGEGIDAALNGRAFSDNPKNGFILIAFPFGGDGRANYISNANRAEVVAMLKHQIARFEGQPDIKGTA